MPLTLAKVRDRVVAASLELDSPALFGTEKPVLEVTYRPGSLTPLFEAEINAFGTSSDGWAALVAGLVASWDLIGDDGSPVPLTLEALRGIPAPFLGAVVQAIREEISPSSPTDESSGDGSSPAGSSVASPTTIHSFEQPA